MVVSKGATETTPGEFGEHSDYYYYVYCYYCYNYYKYCYYNYYYYCYYYYYYYYWQKLWPKMVISKDGTKAAPGKLAGILFCFYDQKSNGPRW